MTGYSSTITSKGFGRIQAKSGANLRTLYEHQRSAMHNLDILNQESNYSTLVVLPTGGGKTYTASTWLLRNAINQNKKILWIAHRQMLLDQAAESFQKYAYSELLPNISSFQYRIVSGSDNHERTIDITASDNLLIISKDSIGRNLSALDKWLKNEKELFVVVDEAHHSTAKTYRKVIDYVQKKVPNVKLIGLTATPFRTADAEQGLLSKIYQDGIQNGQVVKGDIGIAFQIGLKELINRQILSKPIFESYYTEQLYGENLGLDAWNSIEHLDALPDSLANQIADSAARNRLIVETYKAHQKEYGQTIVFAVNVAHAISLCAIFNKAGIAADYIVSEIKDAATGVRISREDNDRKLEAYRMGVLKVLVNVNILTEGVDLPQTKTVFLARPTVSSILMTQMIGRALRGSAAGGTDAAYIVSFVDNWNEHIAWVNPESLFEGNNDFTESESERQKRDVHLISLAKLEEFALMLDDSVDTALLESVPFEKRIPLGMYAFTYLEENGVDHTYQVMVYDSTQAAYSEMMSALPELFDAFHASESEYLSEETLSQMESQCRESFFLGQMIPSYEKRDVIQILQYYAQYEQIPQFYTFNEIARKKLDITDIAAKIVEEDMGTRRRTAFINQLWENQDANLMKLFFGRKTYFVNQLDKEVNRIADPELYVDEQNVVYGQKQLETLPLHKIGQLQPEYEKQLRDGAFAAAMDKDGYYTCAHCGRRERSRVHFQVDHVLPMNQGGKSVPENLQILCRKCNGEKGDQL